MFRSILVSLDGSPTANAGLRAALELARDHGARLTGLHVIDDRGIVINLQQGDLPAEYFHKLYATMRKHGQTVLTRAQAVAQKAGVPMTSLLADSRGNMVAHAILDQARKTKADMIVMGTHGRRGVARAILGSDAEEVLREANVPVLLIRSPRHSKRKGVPSPKAAPSRRKGISRAPDMKRLRDRTIV
jgi:nucleotide-binding universal stress UspA family protein